MAAISIWYWKSATPESAWALRCQEQMKSSATTGSPLLHVASRSVKVQVSWSSETS